MIDRAVVIAVTVAPSESLPEAECICTNSRQGSVESASLPFGLLPTWTSLVDPNDSITVVAGVIVWKPKASICALSAAERA